MSIKIDLCDPAFVSSFHKVFSALIHQIHLFTRIGGVIGMSDLALSDDL